MDAPVTSSTPNKKKKGKHTKLFIWLFACLAIIIYVIWLAALGFFKKPNINDLIKTPALIALGCSIGISFFVLLFIYLGIGFHAIKHTKMPDKGKDSILEQLLVAKKSRQFSTWSFSNQYQMLAEDKQIIKERLNIDYQPKRVSGNIITIGGSGSGKTQNVIIPTIFYNINSAEKPSMIVTDPKGEIFQRFKEYAPNNGYVLKNFDIGFDSMNPISILYHCYTSGLFDQYELYMDCICYNLFLLNNATEISNTILYKTLNFFKTIISICHEINLPLEEFTLQNILKLGREWDYKFYKTHIANIKKKAITTKILSTKYIINELATPSSKHSSILKEAISLFEQKLDIFSSESINKLTEKNTIFFKQIIEKPTVLFIRTGKNSYLTTLMLGLLHIYQDQYLINNNQKSFSRSILYIIDEFGNLPKIDFIQNSFSIDRYKNISTMITVQSLHQMVEIYGEPGANIIKDNSPCICICHTTDVDLASELSKRAKGTILESAYVFDLNKQTEISPTFFIDKKPDEFIIVCQNSKPYKYKVNFFPMTEEGKF